MAETTSKETEKKADPPKVARTEVLAKKPAPDKSADDGDAEEKSDKKEKKPGQPPPPMIMRVLLGVCGLGLLVGFFLPWVRVPPAEEGATATFQSGLDLLFSANVEGTPPAAILIVPILGGLLSAISFMGMRYAAQTAIGVAVAMIGYGLYVLFTMFVQHTAMGLWVVAGGTFLTLLLGVATWMLARRAQDAQGAGDAKS